MNPRSRQSPPVGKPNAAGLGCLRVFFLLFLVAGCGVFHTMTIKPLIQVVKARSWVETPCVVDSSQVAVVTSNDTDTGGPTYKIEVSYHYEFQGLAYASHRYEFTEGSTSAGRARKQRIVDQLRPGSKAVCYVDPEHPTEAVMNRGISGVMFVGGFFLIFVAVGGLGFWFAPRLANRGASVSRNAMPQVQPASGERTALKPQTTPLGKFFMLFGFAVFWNGFISIFVYLVFFSHQHESPLLAKIFVGVFGFIGVLILFAAGGSFLALWNPTVQLAARGNTVALGGEFLFEWSVKGRAERFRKIRIVLEGREEAVDTAGDSTSSFKSIFAEIPIVETMDQEISLGGQGRVTIPANSMHSFKGAHNQIIWRLRVRGEIPRWPAFEEDFIVTVVPGRAIV